MLVTNAFVAFFNNILRISVARYYAYSIGEGSTIDNSAAAADLSRWFNAALSLHLIVPVIFILLGVPLAEYAIRNWINITPERIFACIWVFRIALLTSFVSMASVPFISMYTARQLIWELSLFGILSSVLNFAFARVLCFVSGDRLIVYAIFMLIVNAGIPLVQIFRAMVKFPECRMRLSFWGDWGYGADPFVYLALIYEKSRRRILIYYEFYRYGAKFDQIAEAINSEKK